MEISGSTREILIADFRPDTDGEGEGYQIMIEGVDWGALMSVSGVGQLKTRFRTFPPL